MDSRKLSTEASLHAAQNDRLPVRAVIQVLFSEQTKLNVYRHLDWSGSIGGRSPSGALDGHLPARCQSKREITAQQMEIKRLKDTVVRVQNQCNLMQAQMERLSEKRTKAGFFKWRKFGFKNPAGDYSDKIIEGGGGDQVDEAEGFGRQTPMDIIKTKLVKRRTPSKTWRKSVS